MKVVKIINEADFYKMEIFGKEYGYNIEILKDKLFAKAIHSLINKEIEEIY